MELARRLKEGVDFLLCYGFTGAAQALTAHLQT
jgi:hypothetical protein